MPTYRVLWKQTFVLTSSAASAAPQPSMKELLGIKDDNMKVEDDVAQKQREKTAYVVCRDPSPSLTH